MKLKLKKLKLKLKPSARVEQFRQARRIHGGTLKMCAATLGVKLSRVPIPSRWLRKRVYMALYGKKYKSLNESELEQPLTDFRSINALFTRGVRPECRPISETEQELLCPCDSTIQDVGKLGHDRLLTVKGIDYSLESLLPGMNTERFHNGAFTIFFLSPADCHRIFAPDHGAICEIAHVPGRRLLVHPPYQRQEFPVFTLNERVILRLKTTVGECILVMVAGWGVGNITYPFNVPFKVHKRRITRFEFAIPHPVARGEWIATFELGSTVILITEPTDGVMPLLARDEQVIYGQPAFSFHEFQGGTCPLTS